MADSGHATVELQLAARDANTRKLAAQLGKRPKWVVKEISTQRHLSTIVNHILRYLSLDGGHQVILFPDTTVHTHLKSTSISWGPNVDPTSQLLDVFKILGCPDRLQLLFHVITPEASSPAGKSPARLEKQDQELQQDQHMLQPRQLALDAAMHQLQQRHHGLLQADQQQQLLHSTMQQLTQSSQQAASVQQEHSICQPAASNGAAVLSGARTHQQQRPTEAGSTPLSVPVSEPWPAQQGQVGQHAPRQHQQQDQLARLYGDLQLLPALQPFGHLPQQASVFGMPPASLQQLILQQPSLPVMSQQQQQHCQQLLLAQQQQQFLQRMAQLHQLASSGGFAWAGLSAGLPGLHSLTEGFPALGPGAGVPAGVPTSAAAAAGGGAELSQSWLQQQHAADLAGQGLPQPQRSSHSQQSVPQGSKETESGPVHAGLGPTAAAAAAAAAGGPSNMQPSRLQLEAQQQQQQQQQQHGHLQGAIGMQHLVAQLQQQQQLSVDVSALNQQLQNQQLRPQQQHEDLQHNKQGSLPGSMRAACAATGRLAQLPQHSAKSGMAGPGSPSYGVPQVSLSASAGAPSASAPTAAAARQQAAQEQLQEQAAQCSERGGHAADGVAAAGQAGGPAAPRPQHQQQPGPVVQQQQGTPHPDEAGPHAAVAAAQEAAAAAQATTVVYVKGSDGTMMELQAVLENGKFVLQLPQAPAAQQLQQQQKQQPWPAQVLQQQQQGLPVQQPNTSSAAVVPAAPSAAGMHHVQQLQPPANVHLPTQQVQHGRDELRVAALLAQQQQQQMQQQPGTLGVSPAGAPIAQAPAGSAVAAPAAVATQGAAPGAHTGLVLQVPQAVMPGGFTESPAASPALDAAAEDAPASAAAAAAAAAAAIAAGGADAQTDTPDAGALRSHCSSVSCGGPATGSGPSSKYRHLQQHQHAVDVAGVGGSATRSGLRVQGRPDTSGPPSEGLQEAPVHSENEKQQRSSSSISRDSFRGRGILQPRQLQLQDAPSTSTGQRRQQQASLQQQQSKPPQQQHRTVSGQWQPQLQCISEECTPTGQQQAAARGRMRQAGSVNGTTPAGTPTSGGTAAVASGRVHVSQSGGLQLELSDMDGAQPPAASAPAAATAPTSMLAAAQHAGTLTGDNAVQCAAEAKAVAAVAAAAAAAAAGSATLADPAAAPGDGKHTQSGAMGTAGAASGADAAVVAEPLGDEPTGAARADSTGEGAAAADSHALADADGAAAAVAAEVDADADVYGDDGDHGYGYDGDEGFDCDDMPSPGDAHVAAAAAAAAASPAAPERSPGKAAAEDASKALQAQQQEQLQQQREDPTMNAAAALANGPEQQQEQEQQQQQQQQQQPEVGAPAQHSAHEQQHSSGPASSCPHHQQQQPTSSKRSYSDAQGSAAAAADHVAAHPTASRQEPAAHWQQERLADAPSTSAGFQMPAPPAKRSKHDSVKSSCTQAAVPGDEARVGVPTIACQGRTAAGTWHISTGGWDSRPDETPLTHQDYTGGSIYSVSQLLQQQELTEARKQQQQQQGTGSAPSSSAGPGTGLRVVGSRAGIRRGPVPAGSLPRAGVRKGPPRAGYRGPQGPPPLSQLQFMQQQQQQMLGQPYCLPGTAPRVGYMGDEMLMQHLDFAEARVAAAMAGGMGHQAAAAAAAAVGAGNGVPCSSAGEPRPASSTGTGQSLSLAQRLGPTGSQTTTGAEPQQQQQQQQQQMQMQPQGPPSGQWDGFQMLAAPAAATPAASGSTGSQGHSPADPQQQAREDAAGSVAAAAGVAGVVLSQQQPGIDYSSLQAILQSNSVMALEEQQLLQQGAGASGQGSSMQEALRAAGVLPAAAAAAGGGAQCSSGSSGQQPGSGSGRKKVARGSRAPLPAPAAGPQPQGAAAAGLQRYCLPTGQVVYVAAQPPPAPASQAMQLPGVQGLTDPAAGAAAAGAASTAAMHGPPTAAQLAAAVNSLAASQPDGVAPTPIQQKLMAGLAGGNSLWGGLSSGFQTPAVLSPNSALAAAAERGLTTADYMDALLSDKDLTLLSALNTPDKGGLWPNGGSLLSTPAGLLLSPMPPPPKRQLQQAPAAGAGPAGAQQQQQQVADLQAMYQSFREAAAGPAAAAGAAGQTAAAGPSTASQAAAAAVAGRTPVADAHADDTMHGVGDLCAYILDSNRGDSWLMPPPAAAAAAGAAAAACANAAAVQMSSAMPAAQAGAAAEAAGTEATVPEAAAGAGGARPKRQAKAGAGQGRRNAAAGAARQRKPAASTAKQQQGGQQQQQQTFDATEGGSNVRVWGQLFNKGQ